MKNVVLVLLTLSLGANAVRAQTSWAENLFTEGPKGMSRDFGTVPRGTQLYHKFKVKNIYNVPLEISTRVGCNCVTVTSSNPILQPTQEGTIDIVMDATRFTGPKAVSIYVTVGPQFISSATLRVSANSRADVVLNPGQISFGIVPAGQVPAPQTIDVEYAGVLPWQITEIVRDAAPLNTTFKELYRRPGQVGYRVTVFLKSDAPAGALKHELLLKTNDAAGPLVPILVEATVQATLTVSPNTVNVGGLKVGDSLTKLVMVKGTGPFRVTAVEGLGDGVAADLPEQPAPVQIIRVKCQPNKPGTLHRELRIKTDLEPAAAITFTVEGAVQP
jgi:hypothetical protein